MLSAKHYKEIGEVQFELERARLDSQRDIIIGTLEKSMSILQDIMNEMRAQRQLAGPAIRCVGCNKKLDGNDMSSSTCDNCLADEAAEYNNSFHRDEY